MIRLAYFALFAAVGAMPLSAVAQDFSVQDPRYTTTPPRYTTTPPRYTTTPPEYTTTPPRYTTTPPAYVPQPDTVPSDDDMTPTRPGNVPDFDGDFDDGFDDGIDDGVGGGIDDGVGGGIDDGVGGGIDDGVGGGIDDGVGGGVGETMFMPSQLNNTTLQNSSAPRSNVSPPAEPFFDEQTPENEGVPGEETTTGNERVVELFAALVLRLDEGETQQFVGDYQQVVADLGLQSSEVTAEVNVRIVLYLTLSRLLGLSGEPLGAEAI